MTGFAAGVAAFRAKVKVEADRRVRAVVFEMARRVIMRTPVDTARARGSWSINVGPQPTWTDPGVADAAGTIALGTVSGQVAQVKAGDVAWIASGLPYMQRLEHGWSKQAPAGMVKVTAIELQSVVEGVRTVGVAS